MISDSQSILDDLKLAVKQYAEEMPQVVADAQSKVAEWRLSNQDILPLHPFGHLAKTDCVEGFWQVSKQRWIDDAGEVMFPTRVGLDDQLRPVISAPRGDATQTLIVRNRNTIDVIDVCKDKKESWDPARESGLPFCRVYLDDDGRMTQIATLRDSSLKVEQFCWLNGRIVTSTETVHELSDDLMLVEKDPVLSQHQEYLYDEVGQLLQVNQNRHAIFSSGRGDTLESVISDSVAQLSEAIVARIVSMESENADPSNRLKRLVLVYSAEHAHCGLPSEVRFAREDEDHSDLFYAEELDPLVDWIPDDKIQNFDCLLIRLYQLVDSPEVFLEGEAVLPFRQMLQRLAKNINEEMSKLPGVVAEEFVAYPVDDHGDVDAEEDFRASVSGEAATRWLAGRDELAEIEDDDDDDEEFEDDDEFDDDDDE